MNERNQNRQGVAKRNASLNKRRATREKENVETRQKMTAPRESNRKPLQENLKTKDSLFTRTVKGVINLFRDPGNCFMIFAITLFIGVLTWLTLRIQP